MSSAKRRKERRAHRLAHRPSIASSPAVQGAGEIVQGPSRWYTLTRGRYAAVLKESAKALGEDFSQFEALRLALLKDYAPQGLYEERLVERMAQLIWRQERLVAHAQRRLANSLAEGFDHLNTLIGSENHSQAEAQLERAISRIHRDLLFLHRYRRKMQLDEARRLARLGQGTDLNLDDVLPARETEPEALVAHRSASESECELGSEGTAVAPVPATAAYLAEESQLTTMDWLKRLETKPSNGKSAHGSSAMDA